MTYLFSPSAPHCERRQDARAHAATAAALVLLFAIRWRRTARLSLLLVACVVPHSL